MNRRLVGSSLSGFTRDRPSPNRARGDGDTTGRWRDCGGGWSGSAAERGRGAAPQARQSLWLGEHWFIGGLQDDGNYMVPAPAEQPERYENSLFDFGRADGTPVDPETRMAAPGMTQFYRAGDGEKPGMFDIDAIRKNEDGGLKEEWYELNEPAANFGSTGRGKWPAGRSPSVMVMDGHVEMIDDGATRAR